MKRYRVHLPSSKGETVHLNGEENLKGLLAETPGAWATDNLSGEAITLAGDDLYTHTTAESRRMEQSQVFIDEQF